MDFLNTRPIQNGEAVELLPDFDTLARWFHTAGLVSSSDAKELRRRWGKSVRANNFVKRVRELRERLRNQVLLWEGGSDLRPQMIKEINLLLAAHPMRIRFRAKDAGMIVEEWFPKKTPEDLLAPLAKGAANLLSTADGSRVHKCANVECVLHFLDTSKKGTRRWCSMRMCGNRLKVAAYVARRRQMVNISSH